MMQNETSIDPNILIQVLQNKLAQASVREAEMEAAIQGLLAQQNDLMARIPKEVPEDVTGTDD